MERKNAVVVITGASSGIGRATALALAGEEANLVLVARREAALHGLAEECERLGANALAVPTDVSIEDHVYGIVRKAVDRFGKIDVWVNNAAVAVAGRFEDIPMEDFRRVLEINLFGYIYGSRAAVWQFKKQGNGGTIINVSSMVALTGEPYFAPYVISKAGIRGLSAALNQELNTENIHVCTVLPTVIDTPIFNQAANYMGKKIVAPGKAIPAEEVAETIIGLIDKPRAEVSIGSPATAAALMRTLAPDFFDRQAHDKMLHDHFDQELNVMPSKGNLYDPMKEYASVSGGWEHQPDNAFMKYAIPATILTGAALGVAFFLRNQRLKQAAE